MIDERTRAALARLTDNEKACLIRRLSHQTAKEMAIDLGVSPHAVEKRLKMARTKLGLSSSLEAAQLLAASEGYGQLGPQPPDLATTSAGTQEETAAAARYISWRRAMPYILMGAVPMSLAIAAVIAALASSQASSVPQASTLKTLDAADGVKQERPRLVKAPPEIVRTFVNESFDIQDKDQSGYLERVEAPDRGYVEGTVTHKGPIPTPGEGKPYPDQNEPVIVIGGDAGKATYLATMDKDADGRVSREEYMTANYPRFLGWGVPANWRGAPKAPAG